MKSGCSITLQCPANLVTILSSQTSNNFRGDKFTLSNATLDRPIPHNFCHEELSEHYAYKMIPWNLTLAIQKEMKPVKKIVAKASDGQRYPCPAQVGCDKGRGRQQGSGPKGVDDLCFHTYKEFSPSPSSDRDLGLWAGN